MPLFMYEGEIDGETEALYLKTEARSFPKAESLAESHLDENSINFVEKVREPEIFTEDNLEELESGDGFEVYRLDYNSDEDSIFEPGVIPETDNGFTVPIKIPNKQQGGDNNMTEDPIEIPTKTEGMDVDLTHKGAETYRENEDAYDLNREETQALGAASYLHEHVTGGTIDVEIEEVVEYVRENDLTDTFRDYKRNMPDIGVVQEAAEEVINTLEYAEDVLEEGQRQSDTYIPVAEEQSEMLVDFAENLNRVHERADTANTDDYTFPEDLRDSREEVLEPNEEVVTDIIQDMEDRL